MKNSGFMKVFKFSYIQAMKSKSTKITLIILLVVALLFFPVKTIVSGGLDDEKEDTKTQLETVYVNTDNEQLYNNIVTVVNGELEKEATFTMIGKDEYDDTIKKLKDDDSKDVYLEVAFDDNESSESFGLSYKIVYGNGEDANDKANTLDSILMDKSKDIVIAYYGISEDVAKTLVPSEYETRIYDAEGNEIIDDSGLNEAEYWLTYGVIMVLIMVTSFIGSMAADGIVGEKANRVIEYIMINLKPMELIIGKVMSSLAIVFTMVGSTLVALGLSTYINQAIDSDAKDIFQIIKGFVDNGTLKEVNPLNIILVILVIVAGGYFYSILGALSGGMVSKVEEMAEGLKIYMMLFLIGAYMAMFMVISANAAGTGWGAFSYVVYLLPISSMFILPSYLLIGKVQLWVVIVAIVIAVVVAALLTALASRIFGQMLYHNGSPLKLKDIFVMAKEGKKHEK